MTNTAAAVAAAKAVAANAKTGRSTSGTAAAGATEDAKRRSRKSLLLDRKSRSPNGGVGVGGARAAGMSALAASPASRNGAGDGIGAADGRGATNNASAFMATSMAGTGAAQMTTSAGIATKPNTTPTKSRFVGKSEPLLSTSAKKRRKLRFEIIEFTCWRSASRSCPKIVGNW